MPVDPGLRTLDLDIPAPPESLARLTQLMSGGDFDMPAVAQVVETDMSIAAAVLKAVNSSMYGLRSPVRSVQQAIVYLGTREVAAVTLAIGLRAAFPSAPALDALWQRAAQRGLFMGRVAHAMGIDSWTAHSAGLFEECGKAVLYRYAPERYLPLLAQAGADDEALVALERDAYGVTFPALGAALCESWGLHKAAATAVRLHLQARGHELPDQEPLQAPRREVCALSALAHAWMAAPDTVAQTIAWAAAAAPFALEPLARAVDAMQALRDGETDAD